MLNLPGWTGIKYSAVSPKWLAVKDERVQYNPACSNMPSTHKWVRGNIQYKAEIALKDMWQKPSETLQCRSGDCEDICILERALLIAAGYLNSDIEMLIVWDLLTREYHALLFVKDHFLDNRVQGVLHVSQFRDYRPFMGYRGNQAFLYGRTI